MSADITCCAHRQLKKCLLRSSIDFLFVFCGNKSGFEPVMWSGNVIPGRWKVEEEKKICSGQPCLAIIIPVKAGIFLFLVFSPPLDIFFPLLFFINWNLLSVFELFGQLFSRFIDHHRLFQSTYFYFKKRNFLTSNAMSLWFCEFPNYKKKTV